MNRHFSKNIYQRPVSTGTDLSLVNAGGHKSHTAERRAHPPAWPRENKENTGCWEGWKENGTVTHCWWRCNMV